MCLFQACAEACMCNRMPHMPKPAFRHTKQTSKNVADATFKSAPLPHGNTQSPNKTECGTY